MKVVQKVVGEGVASELPWDVMLMPLKKIASYYASLTRVS